MKVILAESTENDKQDKLVREMYKIVKNFLEDIMHQKWMGGGSKLVLLGGIMINVDNGDDMFLPIDFEVRTRNGKVIDLRKGFKVRVQNSNVDNEKPGPVKQVVQLSRNWQNKFSTRQAAALKKHFRYSFPGANIEEITYKVAEKYGLTAENTIYA